ncbi:MAG: benenodin family lasso peptide [Rhodanobacter sp.]|nr:MAG: benenodin family lasso peptide [Rhodanobacter sp.]TAL92834.1 MAG: benenodin family lasso peptide [Rhodanobacter sp.]TAM39817.1 MAG: benenodin family lasso peptide [Rhodanobacter sp.]
MNTNENIHTDTPEDVIELGVASVETQGLSGITENFGAVPVTGISDA